MEIGTIIKKYRRQRDMNQEALAEYLRVSVSAVSQWESGKTAPDLALIPAICNLFAIRDKQLALYDILIEDGNYGFYHNRMDNIHRGQAKYYAEIGDAERTLHHLSAAADHAITFVVTEGECEYTSLLLRGSPLGHSQPPPPSTTPRI